MHRTGFVRCNLVVDGIGAGEFAYEFPARTGCTHAANVDLRTEIFLNIEEPRRNYFDRTARCGNINFLQQMACRINHNQVRAYGSNVDAEVGIDTAVGAPWRGGRNRVT
jgi:hypothetical protein